MKKSKKRWLVLGAVILIGGILGLGHPGALSASPQGVLKQAIHWSMSADWFDPATGTFPLPVFFPMYLFHDALLKPMSGGLYTPSLAESWTISSDARVYEFKLRSGVKFHNEEPFTADDVVFSLQRYKGSQAKMIQGKIEKVEAVNPHLVRIHFKEPFPDFLEYLLPGATSMAWIVPKKYVQKVGEAEFKKHPVGAGPYKFVEYSPGVKLVAEAFPGYWRKMPNVKRLEFYFIPEPATRLAMVKRGEVDIATLMQGVFYEEVKRSPNLRLLTPKSPVAWMVYLAAQWDPKSPWSDPRVRKAASLAIDRKTLADIFAPGVGPMGSIGLEGDPLATHFPADPYDPQAAKKLLAEAGYPNGFHGGKFYPYQSGYWPQGEQVANYWKAVGISMDTSLLDKPALLATREGGKMKGATFIDNPTAPTIGGRFSTLFSGRGSYGNYPDIQALWEQYNKTEDLKIRRDLITRIQKMAYERTMWIPLTESSSPAAFGPKVKGTPYKIQPLIWFTCPFEDIELVN